MLCMWCWRGFGQLRCPPGEEAARSLLCVCVRCGQRVSLFVREFCCASRGTGSSSKEVAELLEDFGFARQAGKKKRGQPNAEAALTGASPAPSTPAACRTGSCETLALPIDAGLHTSTPPKDMTAASDLSPATSKFDRALDLPREKLKARQAIESKWSSVKRDCEETILKALNLKAEHECLAATEKDILHTWLAMSTVRQKLLVKCLDMHTDESALRTHWQTLEERELQYANMTLESLTCAKHVTGCLNRMQLATSKAELEECKTQAIHGVSTMAELCKSLKRAIADYSNAARAQQRSLTRQEQMAKRRSPQEEEGARPSKQPKRSIGGSHSALFTCTVPEGHRMIAFESPEDFLAASKNGEINIALPYIVKHFPVDTMSDATKMGMRDFLRDFPKSPVMFGPKPTYRGQSFFQHTDLTLHDSLLKMAPLCHLSVPDCCTDVVRKHLGCAFFGRGPKLQDVSPDFMGLPSLRVVTDGMCKLVCVDLEEFRASCQEDVGCINLLRDKLNTLRSEELKAKMREIPTLRVGIIGTGWLVYIPAGMLIGEQTLRSGFVFGIRKSLLLCDSQCLQKYMAFLEADASGSPNETKTAAREIMEHGLAALRQPAAATPVMVDGPPGEHGEEDEKELREQEGKEEEHEG